MKPNYRRGWLILGLLLLIFAFMWFTVDGKKPTTKSPKVSFFSHLRTTHLTVGLAGPSPTATPSLPVVPKGVFYLPSSQTWDNPTAGQAQVLGGVVGSTWGNINPAPGVFTWNTTHAGADSFDAMMTKAMASGNIVAIRIGISSGGGGDDPCHGGNCSINPGGKPQWLEDQIVAKGHPLLTFYDGPTGALTSQTKTFIPPWDPDLIAAYAAMYQALANHLAGNSKVKVIQWQYMNYNSNDWNPGNTSSVVDGLPPSGSSPASRWMDAVHYSYTAGPEFYSSFNDAAVDAGKKTLTACHDAFPGLVLVSAIGRINNTPDGTGNLGLIPLNVMEWGHSQWPGHVAITKQSLNANVPVSPATGNQWNDYFVLQQYGLPAGMQAVWKCVQDCFDPNSSFNGDDWAGSRMHGAQICDDAVKNFVDTVNVAETYSPSWVEFYEADLGSLNDKPYPNFSPSKDPHIPTTGFNGTSAPYPADAVSYAASVLNH